MASIRINIRLEASAEAVWDAVKDYGRPHVRLTPGVLTDARLEEGGRVVTFANGLVAREALIDSDNAAMRLAYTVLERFEHHSASMHVLADGERCTLVWTTDVLPNDRAPMVRALMEHGAAAMQHVFPLRPAVSTRAVG